MFNSSCWKPKILIMLITYHFLCMPVGCIAKAGYLDELPMNHVYEEVLDSSAYDSDVKIPGKHFPKSAYSRNLENIFHLRHDEPKRYYNDRTARYNDRKDNYFNKPRNGPSFSRHMKRNLTVQSGKLASLICIVHNIGDKSVSWLKSDELRVLSVGKYKYTTNRRTSILYYPTREEWILTIFPVTQNDSGKYICQISTKPVLNYIMQLSIVGYYVPSLKSSSFYQLNDEDSNRSKNQITTPSIYIVNPDIMVRNGEVIYLTCVLKTGANFEVSISWRQNQKALQTNSKRVKINEEKRQNGSLFSSLLIRNATMSDSGSYSCKSSSGHESMATVRVSKNENKITVESNSTSNQPDCILDNYLLIILILYWVKHRRRI